jgi:hypothetical protein
MDHNTTTEMAPRGRHEALGYLEDVRALAREIETAIAAITSNTLPLLQESLARQEMLCTLLGTKANRARQELILRDGRALADFEREIGALGAIMRTYNSLLKRCGKTNALLISLCKSYTGAYGAVHALPNGRALSCEV